MATSKMSMMVKGGDPDEERAAKLKAEWNNYVTWLEKKKIAGHPMLDTGVGENNTGLKYIKMYQKEHPNTVITPESIKEVQSHFKNYRDFAISQLRAKKSMITDANNPNGRYVAPDENLDNFMKDLSVVDGIPGQKTTMHKFPESFLKTVYKDPNGQVKSTTVVNQGFAKPTL